MNKEIESLKMQVKHYEEKEKRLTNWLRERRDLAKENTNSNDNYSINLAWSYYRKALRDVLKQIEVLERVIDD